MISDKMDHSEKYYAVGLSLSGLVFEISANYEHPLFLPIKRLWYFYSCKKNYEKFSLIFFRRLIKQYISGNIWRGFPTSAVNWAAANTTRSQKTLYKFWFFHFKVIKMEIPENPTPNIHYSEGRKRPIFWILPVQSK